MAAPCPVPRGYGIYVGLHIILPLVYPPLLFSRRNAGAGGRIVSTASFSLASSSEFRDTDSNPDNLDDDDDDDATELA